MTGRRTLAAVMLGLVATAPAAAADPLRLRGDALASTASPVGLLTLDGDAQATSWLDAEALVWLGAGAGLADAAAGGDADGDALVIALRARAPGGRAEARLGRLVVTAGALRPLHLDGAAGRVRLPRRIDVEAFAGVPVVPGLTDRGWDWAAGGRVGRRLGDWGGVGVAVLERRDAGRLAVREVGVDGAGGVGAADLTGKLAFDTIGRGVALAQASIATRRGPLRAELYGVHRGPAHLVPATSLFSVLGDVAAQRAGARATWRAAPRLDVVVDAGARASGGELGEDLTARAVLRLDDRGRGALTAELQRIGGDAAAWTGVRVAARVPIAGAWVASTELELVAPDAPDGRGALWPWALAALAWTRGAWDAAIAVEASASSEHRHRVDTLARIGRRWELP